ncbi:sulfurtransferase complex subunit TusB [Pseudomonas sp. N040]|uniref:sulfurtransferase complex subunit TusB n=1 Tax=Pseudomonas sp. N040 TaxID=2785325 RepID=UPI0018A2E656|nr:sulfurtransferase complex subunit TusB [Pseudomonas sp. N040]MBF7731444.1 sulfurtransferase complex subunit TusB [Pseudomonas sp. N040]MBW7015088.1 sulfurtransferase complex subunit TusB [Pseudomonas sp. N040]
MSTLHLLSHSPFGDSRFSTCLRLLAPGDGLLLSGDAVYALQAGSQPLLDLQQLPASVNLFALQEDLLARALTGEPGRVTLIDYATFVDLCVNFSRVNSWL